MNDCCKKWIANYKKSVEDRAALMRECVQKSEQIAMLNNRLNNLPVESPKSRKRPIPKPRAVKKISPKLIPEQLIETKEQAKPKKQTKLKAKEIYKLAREYREAGITRNFFKSVRMAEEAIRKS